MVIDHGALRHGCDITRRCSGPSRRVNFLWSEGRRGAGSATNRHYVRRPKVGERCCGLGLDSKHEHLHQVLHDE